MTEPITLDQAKQQLKVEGTTDSDELIGNLITAAREHVEDYCGITLIPASATMTFASFADLNRLTKAPVTAVTEIRYIDPSGVEQVLAPAVYELFDVNADQLRPRVRLAYGQAWPAIRAVEDAVRVSASVGYSAAPAPVVQAMLMLITQWYDIRTPVAVDVRGVPTEIPNAVAALLANYRR